MGPRHSHLWPTAEGDECVNLCLQEQESAPNNPIYQFAGNTNVYGEASMYMYHDVI